VNAEEKTDFTPTYASPIKGEEGGGRKISLKLMRMGVVHFRQACLPSFWQVN
jgi:hypothetical protein